MDAQKTFQQDRSLNILGWEFGSGENIKWPAQSPDISPVNLVLIVRTLASLCKQEE